MEKVFVYGTLKEGHMNNRLLAGSRKIGNGSAQGELRGRGIPYFLPRTLEAGQAAPPEGVEWAPPAPVWEDGDVPLARGEVWEVSTEDMTRRLDRLEGFWGNRSPEDNHYLRVRVLVMLEDEKTLVEAWAYTYNVFDGSHWWDEMPVIQNGEYTGYEPELV